MTDIEQHDGVEVFVGVEVGKGAHHAVALGRKGKRHLDTALPNDETKLRSLIGKLKEYGTILLVVDQPTTVAGSSSCSGWRRRRPGSLFAWVGNAAHCRLARR